MVAGRGCQADGASRARRDALALTAQRAPALRSAAGAQRNGLVGMVDRYLAALAAHDPSRLPLAADARFTENGRQLGLGEGLWRTATGIPDHDYAYVEDCKVGQICWFGVVDEGTRAAVICVRLRVRDGRIGEIETIVRREAPRLYDPANMVRPRAIVFDAVDPAERSAPAGLVAIGNGYFDGIERLDAGLIAIREDCLRIENGSQTVLLADVSAFAGSAAELIFPMSVREQVESGYVAYIDAVRDRRVVAIDEARGLVAMVVVFDHPARIHSVAVRGVGEVELPEYHRSANSILIAELFKIRAGRIEHIEAVLESIPFGAPTGWEG